MPASGRIDELRKRYDENQRRFFAPLANEYRKSGDLEQAIALCRMHLAEAPANLNGQIVFGQALYEAGSLDEARIAFEAAIALDPENLIALRHLGDISREQGDIPKAREWYRRVLDADRRNEEVIAILQELDAVEAAGGQAAVPERSGTTDPGGIETIELEEPPMRAPAPARPSIMSLIGAPPDDVRESAAEEPPAPAPEIDVDTHVIEIETTALVEEPMPQRAAAELTESPVPEPDTIDFGMVDASIAEAEPAVPESSFGFDVDLGAAADIPVATSVGDTGDFGVVELPDDAPFRETEELKPAGIETASDSFGGSVNLAEPTATPVDDTIDLDSFGTVDIDTPKLESDFISELESDPVSVEPHVPEPAPPKLELVRDTPVETFELDTADTVELDDAIAEVPGAADLVIDEPPVVPPVVESKPRRSTPVVFNFDLSVDDAPRSPTPMQPVAAVVESTPADSFEPLDLGTEPDAEDVSETPAVVPPSAETFATETMAELYVKQGLRHEAIAVYKQLIEARPGDEGLRKRLAELEGDGRAPVGNSARDFFSSLSRRTAKGRPTGAQRLPSTTPPRGSLDKLFDGSEVARHDQRAAESLSAAFGAAPAQPEESALDRVFNTGPARPPGK